MTPCPHCGAPRRWPYCTECDSLFGLPVVAWVLLLFLGLGVVAMFTGGTLRL